MRRHQNHHPRPTLKPFGAWTTALWLRCHDVVDLHGDVGVGPVGGADDPRVAIELLQRHEARRHAELGVEVLVAHEGADVAERRRCQHAVAAPRRRSRAAPRAMLASSRRSRRPSASFELAGVADGHLRELAAQLEPIARVARVGLGDAHRHVESRRNSKPTRPLHTLAPSVRPGTPTYSRRPVERRRCGCSPASPSAAPRECLRRRVNSAAFERRHHVRAIAPARGRPRRGRPRRPRTTWSGMMTVSTNGRSTP